MYCHVQVYVDVPVHIIHVNMYENINSLGCEQGLDVEQSPNAQDAFQPMPGLFSCAGVTGSGVFYAMHACMCFMYSRVLWAGTTSLSCPNTGLRPTPQRDSEENTESREINKTRSQCTCNVCAYTDVHRNTVIYYILVYLSQSAGSYDDMQDVAASSPRSQRPSGGGGASNIRAKFESMANAEQEVYTYSTLC